MNFNDLPVALTSHQPYCSCGDALSWPAAAREQPTRPVLLTCPRCLSVVRAVYMTEMVVPRLPAPSSGDDCGGAYAAHPSHEYDIHTDCCKRCGQRWTLSHMGPLNPVMRQPCRGCSTSMPDLAQQLVQGVP